MSEATRPPKGRPHASAPALCAIFGGNSRKWSARPSDEQRNRWTLAGAQVMSHPRLAQKGPLTGQQFWQAISSCQGHRRPPRNP